MTILFPFMPTFTQAGIATFTLDAVSDMTAWQFEAQSTTAIKKVQFHIDTKTGTPGNLDVYLTADNNGSPNIAGGVPVDIGGGSPTLVSIANGSLAAGVNTATFTNAYTPTIGTKYWVVLFPGAGGSGWSASHRYIFTMGTNAFGGGKGEKAANSTDTGATWSLAGVSIHSFSLQDASDNYLMLINSAVFSSSNAAIGVSDASNPDEYGMIFTNPSNAAVDLHGIGWFYRLSNATTSDHTVAAYTDPLGTPSLLESITIDVSAYFPAATTNQTFIERWKSGPYTLASGAEVAVSVKATGAGTVTHAQVLFHSNAARMAALMLMDWYGVTRNGGSGAFTPVTTAWYSIFPVYSVEAPTPSGGGLARIIGG